MGRAVVLLSGGLDSATTLAIARSQGFEAHALSIDYGQRHRRELDGARRVAQALGAAQHTVLAVDLRAQHVMRDELIAAGRARPHHVLPDSGWVTVPMGTVSEVASVIELFRQNYERVARARR